MVDIVAPDVRSRMMSGIRGKDTKPELMLRRALHARGLRYRLHDRRLPGSPDLVFPRFGAVLFVHGCFWHRHPGCDKATTPSTRPEFWAEKFRQNVERDARKSRELRTAGWRVGTIWECEIGKEPSPTLLDRIEDFLRSGRPELS